MRLSVQGSVLSEAPDRKVIKRAIACLRSEGPKSFCCLESENGDFIQAAGGNYLFLLERKDCAGKLYRGSQFTTPIVPFPDDTELRFSGNVIKMRSLDWVNKTQVLGAFLEFAKGCIDKNISWRDYDPDGKGSLNK